MEREARAISALQHANICTLYDIGAQDGTEFLVMEYLEGQTLAERLEKGPLPLRSSSEGRTEIAQALEKAHQQGIIHRDLKPANIMLTKAGAKLMDFGLAKPKYRLPRQAAGPLTPSTPTMNLASLTSAASPLTQKGSIVGTFQYIAPEVLQGAEADARSDLFSFGCVLYEMVTGRRAFEGKSQLSVFTAILEKDPEPISVIQPLSLPCLIAWYGVPCQRSGGPHSIRARCCDGPALGRRCCTRPILAKSPAQFNRVLGGWIGALLLVLIGIAAFSVIAGQNPSNVPFPFALRNSPAGRNSLLDTTGDAGGMPVLSPQGDKLAFVAHSGDIEVALGSLAEQRFGATARWNAGSSASVLVCRMAATSAFLRAAS